MPTTCKRNQNCCFIQNEQNIEDVKAAVDQIVSCFTQEQLDILEIPLDSGYKPSFRKYLIAVNCHKKPLLKNEEYSLKAKYDIELFKNMFQQKGNEFATREIFCNRFNKLFY